MYIRDADIALLVYDVNNKESFKNINEWFTILKESIKKEIPIFILGNKQDLEKVISDEEVIVYTNSLDANISHFFVSAKTSHNVGKIFEDLKYQARAIIKKKEEYRNNLEGPVTFKLTETINETKKKYNCCSLM